MSLKIKKQEDNSIITIKPNKINWGMVGFLSLILLGFVFILIQIVNQMLTADLNPILILFVGFFFWAAYYNLFNFYYLIVGNEIIEIHDNYIKHTRNVWKISHSKKYLKPKIRNIELDDSTNKFGDIGIGMLGLSPIHVSFKYGRKKKLIGKQIGKDEAKIIIGELENKMYTTQY